MAATKKSVGFPLRRVLSIVTLAAAIIVLLLAMKKPAPVASRQPAAVVSANAATFRSKVDQLAKPRTESPTADVRITADEITAAIEKAGGAGEVSSLAPGDSGEVTAQEPVITIEGDVVRGQFASELGGKQIYVTVAGHLAAKDGYATFEPTEFKIGDLNVPVSLVNGALQKKMLEQRERLKLPDFVDDIRVENGELVVKPK